MPCPALSWPHSFGVLLPPASASPSPCPHTRSVLHTSSGDQHHPGYPPPALSRSLGTFATSLLSSGSSKRKRQQVEEKWQVLDHGDQVQQLCRMRQSRLTLQNRACLAVRVLWVRRAACTNNYTRREVIWGFSIMRKSKLKKNYSNGLLVLVV